MQKIQIGCFNLETDAFENATFKVMLGSDPKLVRHILESNNVLQAPDDQNTWSILWATNSLNRHESIY